MKTVLVLDKMPETCGCCPCVSYNGQAKRWECNAELLCRERYATVKVVDTSTRASWCRLRPLPQEKKHNESTNPEDKDYEDEYDYWHIEGWNDCLKEIYVDLKQKSLLYVAISQLERDKRDYKHRKTKATDKGLVEYYQKIVEACDYAQKIIMEKLNADS